MDPKFFETQSHSYDLTEKSDIYSLGVIFWELTSHLSPFNFEKRNNNLFEINQIKFDILGGMREKHISNTNDKFVSLYKSKYKIVLYKKIFIFIYNLILIYLFT